VDLQQVWQLVIFTKKHIVLILHMEQDMDTDQITDNDSRQELLKE